MRRGLLGFVVLVAACIAGPAHADATHGSTTGVNGVLYDDCVHQPYLWSVSVPDDAGYRALRVTLVDPAGAIADSGFVEAGANQESGTSTFLLCRPGDPFGTYTIRSTVEWGPSKGVVAGTSQLDDSHFTMRKPASRTTLTVSTRRPAYGQLVRYRIRAMDERPTGYAGTLAAWVLLQKRVDGNWVRIKGSRAATHVTGYVSVRLPYRLHHRTMRVRAVTQATSRYARSVSR